MIVGVISPAASANHALVAAEARCDRVVSWVVKASLDDKPGGATSSETRTNDSIEIAYRPKGEGAWKKVDSVALNKANDFAASGSFDLPKGVDAVDVRAEATAKWADGADPGAPRYAVAEVPQECSSMPFVATAAADCKSGGVAVYTHNLNDSEVTATVSADRAELRKVTLGAGEERHLVIPLLDGASTAVRVAVGDFVVAQNKITLDCGSSGASAVVLERCGSRQAVVSAVGSSDNSAELQIRAGGTIIHKGELAPAKTFKRVLELPPAGFVPIDIRIDAEPVAVGAVGNCEGDILGILRCSASAMPGSPSTCDLPAERAQTSAPPPPPPSIAIEAGPGSTLPVTGPWQRAIVLSLGGALLAGGAVALIVQQQRRPKPSLLKAAVDDYRQTWWS